MRSVACKSLVLKTKLPYKLVITGSVFSCMIENESAEKSTGVSSEFTF